jgi:hypothetical protein
VPAPPVAVALVGAALLVEASSQPDRDLGWAGDAEGSAFATHDQEFASLYATRVMRVADGLVVSPAS